MVIGDSGGFQIIGGKLKWEGDKTREQILRWLEANADWAMTLDVPTRARENPNSGYRSFGECLTATIENLDYFSRHRNRDTPVKFLNVLQGEDTREANKWFEAVPSLRSSNQEARGRFSQLVGLGKLEPPGGGQICPGSSGSERGAGQE